jgi:hypothetical protein
MLCPGVSVMNATSELSHSGKAVANHEWNFFNHLTDEERSDLVFSIDNREETVYEGYTER